MRKMALVVATAMMTLSAVPAFAQMTQAEKDECLLASRNCVNQVDDIYKRMHKLNREIKKGTKVCFIERNEDVVIRPLTKDYFEKMAGFLKTGGRMTKSLLEARKQDRIREEKR